MVLFSKKNTGRLLFDSLIARLRMYISLQMANSSVDIREEHQGTLIPYNQEKVCPAYWPLLPYMADPQKKSFCPRHFAVQLGIIFWTCPAMSWSYTCSNLMVWTIHPHRDDRCFKRKKTLWICTLGWYIRPCLWRSLTNVRILLHSDSILLKWR